MFETLFNSFIAFPVLILAATFILGWVLLIPIMILQSLFPKSEAKLERVLQTVGGVLHPVQKFSLWTFVILIVSGMTWTILEGAFPPTDLNRVGSALFTYFGSWFLICIIFLMFKEAAESFKQDSPLTNTVFGKIKIYLVVVAFAGVLSFIIRDSLGTHLEGNDPRTGDGEVVVDYVPTEKQKNELGLKVFLGILIPSLGGVYAGLRQKRVRNASLQIKAQSNKSMDASAKQLPS